MRLPHTPLRVEPLPCLASSPPNAASSFASKNTGTTCARTAPSRAPPTSTRWKIGRATSELQSLMRISYAVFCLKKKNTTTKNNPCNRERSQHYDHQYNYHRILQQHYTTQPTQ